MYYFIRFTDTIEQDIERGTSIITCDSNGHDIEGGMVVNGLCAFGYYESIEDCHIEARRKHKVFGGTPNYAIINGIISDTRGSLGCVVEEPELISKHTV